ASPLEYIAADNPAAATRTVEEIFEPKPWRSTRRWAIDIFIRRAVFASRHLTSVAADARQRCALPVAAEHRVKPSSGGYVRNILAAVLVLFPLFEPDAVFA